jgi:hypothetical protein
MAVERVARPAVTVTVESIQPVLARSRTVVALVMRRGLLVARWTAAEASRIVATAVARARFAMVLSGVASAFAAGRIRVTLLVARVEIARVEIHSRTTLPM